MGNRQTGPQSTDGYAYNANNELLNYSGNPNKGNTYEYDLNGNIIKKTETIQNKAKLITSYTYDDENRLIYVTIARGNKTKEISFAYDPFGRRISKTIIKDEINDDNNTKKTDYPLTTFYIYDNQNVIAEYDQNNTLTASYIYGPNIDEPLSADINNTRIYYHADGLGSITTLTNHMGHKVQQYDYDAFGNIKSTPFWIKQPFTYTGREFDYETGLYYYRARYYDAQAGRFITKDPIGFGGGINQYAYVGNNSVNRIDPMGLYRTDVHGSDTYNICIRAGLSPETALLIAWHNDQTDTKYPSFSSIGNLHQDYINRRDWHFTEKERITELANNSFISCELKDIGQTLHALQDYFSHSLQGYMPLGGHGYEPDPDDPATRPDLYIKMLDATEDLIKQLKDKCKCIK